MYQPLQPSGGYSTANYAAPQYNNNGYDNPWPRTSNSRDEDSMNVHVKTEMRDHHAGKQPDSATSVEDGMHSTSDFVKKLFK